MNHQLQFNYVGLDAGSASLGWAVTNEIKLENVVLRMM